MEFLLNVANLGLHAGLVVLALILLRPALLKLFTAQQRVVIWLVVWVLGYMPHVNRIAVLPVTFQSFTAPRTGRFFSEVPAYIPAVYEGPGRYNLAIPGGAMVEVTLNDVLVYGAVILWLAGVVVICTHSFLRGRNLTAQMKKGRLLTDEDPVYEDYQLNKNILEGETWVWMAEGLPTSFVRSYFFGLSRKNDIVIQAELPRSQMELVLLHEAQHVHLWHPWWKVIASINVVLFWWNPLVWLGFRYFCRDLELACDAAVLKKLSPEKRKAYAKLLLELGSGRQLWEVPLAFGECDAAVRVKTAVKWKPRHMALVLVTWCAAVCLMVFFYGGQHVPYPAADLKLAYEREYGGVERFVADLNLALAQELGSQPVAVEENCPDLGITQVWEAPGGELTRKTIDVDSIKPGSPEIQYKTVTTPFPALWVQTGDGAWYHIYYIWWGEGTNTFHVATAEVCDAPDLTGALQLV